MRKGISVPMLFVLLAVVAVVGQSYAFDNRAVTGTITCTGTTWIDGQQAARGTATLVSDGKGHWTSGSSAVQLGAQGTQGSCEYKLDSGKYEVHSDGSGTSFTHWSVVAANSSSACSRVARSSVLFSAADFTFSGSREGGAYEESGQCSQAQ